MVGVGGIWEVDGRSKLGVTFAGFGFVLAYVGVVAGSCCGGDDECDKITFKKLCCIEEI